MRNEENWLNEKPEKNLIIWQMSQAPLTTRTVSMSCNKYKLYCSIQQNSTKNINNTNSIEVVTRFFYRGRPPELLQSTHNSSMDCWSMQLLPSEWEPPANLLALVSSSLVVPPPLALWYWQTCSKSAWNIKNAELPLLFIIQSNQLMLLSAIQKELPALLAKMNQ